MKRDSLHCRGPLVLDVSICTERKLLHRMSNTSLLLPLCKIHNPREHIQQITKSLCRRVCLVLPPVPGPEASCMSCRDRLRHRIAVLLRMLMLPVPGEHIAVG